MRHLLLSAEFIFLTAAAEGQIAVKYDGWTRRAGVRARSLSRRAAVSILHPIPTGNYQLAREAIFQALNISQSCISISKQTSLALLL